VYLDQRQAPFSSEPTITPRALVVPALIPLVIASVFLVYFTLGSEPNPHAAGGLFFTLVSVTSAIAALIECALVPLSVARLMRHPGLRTRANILSVAFGAVFLVLVAIAAASLYFVFG
jgi:hypothetical protein